MDFRFASGTTFAGYTIDAPLGAGRHIARAAPVDSFGEKGRNAYGLADLLGNVWECVTKPQSVQYASHGGSFADGPGNCRTASTRHRYTENLSATAGFRLCRSHDGR